MKMGLNAEIMIDSSAVIEENKLLAFSRKRIITDTDRGLSVDVHRQRNVSLFTINTQLLLTIFPCSGRRVSLSLFEHFQSSHQRRFPPEHLGESILEATI